MPDFLTSLRSLLVPFVVTLFVLPRFADIASELGLVDHPNKRKIHLTPKPLVGGLAMSLGVAFGCLLFVPLNMIKQSDGSLRGFYAGAILLVVIGFLDDFREVNHRVKFIAQIIASVLIVYFSRTSLHTFGNLLGLGSMDFPAFALPMTILGAVGVMNALNMIDGVDGVAGGISLTAFLAFAFLAYIDNHHVLFLLCLAICGAIIAFLKFNWHPAKLFMGDAGSLFLGFAASFVSIAITQDEGSIVRPVAPLLVLAVPISDTIMVMVKRMIQGKSPFSADKTHLHHLLLKYGFSKRETAGIMIAMTAAFSLLAVVGTWFDIPEYFLFLFFILYFVSSFFVRQVILSHKTKQGKAALL